MANKSKNHKTHTHSQNPLTPSKLSVLPLGYEMDKDWRDARESTRHNPSRR